MEKSRKKAVLFLTRWYPDKMDPQNAVFIQKHAFAASKIANIRLIYVAPSTMEAGLQVRKFGDVASALQEIQYFFKPSSLPIAGKALNLLFYFFGHYKAWRYLISEGFQPDLVHVHMMSRPALIAWIINVITGIPYLVTEHWTGYASGQFQRFSWVKKRLMLFLFNKAQIVTAVSPALESSLHSIGVKSPLLILPNVVEAPNAPKPAATVESDSFQIASVSDFYDDKKNVSGLIDGLTPLLKANPNWKLHLVGDGPDRKKIEEAIAQSGLGNSQVQLYGRVSNKEVLNLMKNIDLYICFSNLETFSVATAEALAGGKPVICTACGGPEYFVRDFCGFVIPKADKESLRRAVKIIWAGNSNFQAEKAKAYILNQFGMEAISQKMQDLYATAISKKTDHGA